MSPRSFVECLEILWKTKEKAPESAKKNPNIPTSFRTVENFRKSPKVLRKNRKCRKVLKTTL